MRSFYRVLLRFRIVALALLLLATFVFGRALLPPDRLLVDFSLDALLVPDAKGRADLRQLHEDFGDDLDLVAILVRLPAPHTVANRRVLDPIATLCDWLRARPEVDADGVVSLLDLPDLQGTTTDGEIRPRALISAQDKDLLPIARALSNHRSYRGLLLSADLRSTLVIAPFATSAPERRHQMLDDLELALTTLRSTLPPGSEVFPVGIPLVQATYTRTVVRDILVLVPLTLLVIAILLGVAFRRAYAVVGPLTGVGLSTIWTLGLIQVLGLPFDMVNSVSGVVILVVGVASGAHIISRHREELARIGAANAPRQVAIIETMVRMTPACFITSATTAVGFGSLASATLPAIRNFGLVLAAGVMLAWLVQMVWMPILLSFIRPHRILPAPKRDPHAGETLFARVLDAAATRVLARPALVVIVALTLGLIAGFFALRLHADARMAGELSSSHPVALGLAAMEDDLSGVLVHAITLRGRSQGVCDSDLDCGSDSRCRRVDPYFASTTHLKDALVALTGVEGDPLLTDLEARLRNRSEGLFDEEAPIEGVCAPAITQPRVIAFITALEAWLESRPRPPPSQGRPLISHVQSLVDLVADLGPLPDGAQARANAVLERVGLLENGAPALTARLLTPDRTRTQIVIRANDIGLAAWRDFSPGLYAEIERLRLYHGLRDDFDLEVTGGSTLAERAISGLAADLGTSLGWGSLLVLTFLIGLVRSVRLGLLAMVPNILPLIYMLGLMGAFDLPIRASTLIVFSVALGIAVDDTTHFIHRYREEVMRQGEGSAAIRTTLIATGHPIVLTSAILICGFMMNGFSDFMAIVEFGLLSAVTLVIALVCDLLVTPALLLLAKGKLGRAWVVRE